MTKKLKAFRFDLELYEKFKALAQNGNLMVTEALEKFMRTCVEAGGVVFPESAAGKRGAETESRVLLTWLQRGQLRYHLGNEEDPFSVTGRLLQLLPRVEDSGLRADIEAELKKKR